MRQTTYESSWRNKKARPASLRGNVSENESRSKSRDSAKKLEKTKAQKKQSESLKEKTDINIVKLRKNKQVAQRATIAHLSPKGKISFKKKHTNGPWKPKAQNGTRPSFCACPGYQQL